MSVIRRGLRVLGLWILPAVVVALLLAAGFVWWCAASQTGTRWLLRTAMTQVDGQVREIRGSLVDGLYVGDLALSLPDVDVRVTGLHLKVLWSELLRRRLHINDLSADRVAVGVRTSEKEKEEDTGPFKMPAVPVGVEVDRLALGGLALRIDGQELPVELLSLSTGLTLDAGEAELRLQELRAAYQETLLSADGALRLRALADPWPFDLSLHVGAQGRDGSPVCLRPLLHTEDSATGDDCGVTLDLDAKGDLKTVRAQARGEGEGIKLNADATVYPTDSFPLGSTQVDLRLSDKTALTLSVKPGEPDADGARRIAADLKVQDLALNPWLPEGIGETLLNLQGALEAGLTPTRQLKDVSVDIAFDGPNRWNGQPLTGSFAVKRLTRVGGVLYDAQATEPWDSAGLASDGTDVSLRLGPDHIEAHGSLSATDSKLNLDAQLPALKALWPGLPGGATLKLKSGGSMTKHQGELEAAYTPENARKGVPGQAPASLKLALHGGWTQDQGWKGSVTRLDVEHAGAVLHSPGDIPLAMGADGSWQVGAAKLDLSLDGEPLLQVRNEVTSGEAGGQWASKGGIDSLVVTPARIEKLQKWLALADTGKEKGGVHTELSDQARHSRLDARLAWDLAFKDTLTGKIALERTDGDLTVPGDVPIKLGLQTARLDVDITRTAPATSRVAADMRVVTRDMGSMRVRADTP